MRNPELWNGTSAWNVPEAENDIYSILQLVNYKKVSESVYEQVLESFFQPNDYRCVVDAAVKEMEDVLVNRPNKLKRHINHIVSGKHVYCLFKNNGYAMTQYGEYVDTKEEAESIVQEIGGMFDKIEIDKDENGKYFVLTDDCVMTEHMREHTTGGEFVDRFLTYEEADDVGKTLNESYYIDEYPSEEWYAVINEETGKNSFTMLFPTQKRALAFMYNEIKPEAWMDYVMYEEVK